MESKKRNRDNNDQMEIDDEILIEQSNPTEFIDVEIFFSNIKEANFDNIKSLIKPIFLFEDINLGDIADILIEQHEDVGTTIKTEDDEETKNIDCEIFGLYSYLPLKYYETKHKVVNKFYSFLKEKITKYAPNNQKENALNIINTTRLCLLINERAINLPQETVAPAMGLITKEINECKEMDDYDGKFDFDYVVIVSKFVKFINQYKGGKKAKSSNTSDEEISFYKYETPYFQKKAVMSLEYRIGYKEKNMDYLENENEPQFINILLIKTGDFFAVLNTLS